MLNLLQFLIVKILSIANTVWETTADQKNYYKDTLYFDGPL